MRKILMPLVLGAGVALAAAFAIAGASDPTPLPVKSVVARPGVASMRVVSLEIRPDAGHVGVVATYANGTDSQPKYLALRDGDCDGFAFNSAHDLEYVRVTVPNGYSAVVAAALGAASAKGALEAAGNVLSNDGRLPGTK